MTSARLRWAMIAVVALVVTGIGPGASSAPAASTRHAAFGKSLVLTGISGERLRVRPYAVVDPLAVSDFADDGASARNVAIRLSITNIGASSVHSAPGNGATLVTKGGRAVAATIVGNEECDTFSSTLVIPRGQTRRGCIGFVVPPGAGLRFFELTWNSGFADVTGQWSLRRAAPARNLADGVAQREADAQRERTLSETVVAPTATKSASLATCARVSRLRFDCAFTVTTRPRPRQAGPTVICTYRVGVRMARTGPAKVTSTRSHGVCAPVSAP